MHSLSILYLSSFTGDVIGNSQIPTYFTSHPIAQTEKDGQLGTSKTKNDNMSTDNNLIWSKLPYKA